MDDMTQTPGQAAGTPHDASAFDRFFGWLRSLDLRRDTEDKWLAGVCSGIATRLGVDPIVIRAALIVLVLLGGVGITLYLIAWAFIPNEREEIVAEGALRHGNVWGIVLLVVIALSLLGGSGFADNNWGFWWFWWIAIPVGLVVWLVTRNKGAGATASSPGQWATTTSPAPGTATGPGSHTTYASAVSTEPAPASQPGGPAGTVAPYGPAHPGPAGPGGQPPYYGPPPPRKPRPPKPPRPPRRRGGGFLGAVLVGGFALASYGLALWAHDAYGWSGSAEVVALAAALGVAGLGVLAMGLAGRRAGLTGFLAVVLALVTWSSSVLPDIDVGGGIGDRTWRPDTAESGQSYRLGLGSGNLHLTDYPTGQVPPGEMDAGVGIGELRIYVPQDLTVEVRSKVAIGEITGDVVQPVSSDRGRDGNREISTVEVIGEGEPELIVNANVGVGQIVIIGRE